MPLLLLLLASFLSAADFSDLAGRWQMALDRADTGIQEHWQTRSFPDSLILPGSLQDQGFGDDPGIDTAWTANVMDRSWWTSPTFAEYRQPGNVKMPCWLTPKKHYVGVAWYRREVEIPAAWVGRRMEVSFERVHWASRLWVDGRDLGTRDSLATAHVYDLGTGLTTGRHVLSLRIDNRMIVDVGNWAHSVSDHTQGNWNGVIGALTLRATAPVWLRSVRALPDVAARTVTIEADLGSAAAGAGHLRVGDQRVPVTWGAEGGSGRITVPLGAGAGLWDEYQPNLHRLEVVLEGAGTTDTRTVTVGLRQIGTTADRQFTLNGREIFLRGTLECCIFPRTGYPPTDVPAWERILRICRDHGLNHLRFHSWCPPRAAFEAADALGFYLQVEVGAWCQVGKDQPIDAWIEAETGRILAEYGNHPSFMLLLTGNEMLPYGSDADRDRYLTAWSRTWAARDPRRLYAGSTLTTSVSTDQFRISSGTYGASNWPQGDYRGAEARVPHLVHEMGQYCVFPDFSRLDRYTGLMQPKNFEIFRTSLERNGLADQAQAFLLASGKLQALCYKEDIESVLRTPGVAGFQLLDLHDFPGQGTALIGVLDAFWEEKGYISPSEYRRFAGPTVPLVRLPRVITADLALDGEILVNHHGAAPLAKAQITWRIVGTDQQVLAQGGLPPRTLDIGLHPNLGRIAVPAGTLPAPGRYRVEVAIAGTDLMNDWDLVVLPATVSVAVPPGVELATRLTPGLLERIEAGATVVLCHPSLGGSDLPAGSFMPVFWNRQWFSSQKTQTLGLRCDPAHPALALFPTAGYTDFLWRDVLDRSGSLGQAGWPVASSIVQWIDDWNTNRPLALVAECRLGKGRLVAGAFDAVTDLDQRPGTRQLLRSLLAYAASPRCAPVHTLDLAAARRWAAIPLMANLGATATADSTRGKYPVAHLVDGLRSTFWHTDWDAKDRGLPHRITITLDQPITATGVRLLPRQDESSRRAKTVVIRDGEGRILVETEAGNRAEASVIAFPGPVNLRSFSIEIRSTWDGDPNVAFAEIDLIPAP